VTPTNGHAMNGHPTNGQLAGHGTGQQDDGEDQYQAQYGGYQEAAPYAAPAGDPYHDYRRPDTGANGYGGSPAEGPVTSGYGIARAAQGPATGSFGVAQADDGYGQGYATGSYPTAHYQPDGYGRLPGTEIEVAGQGYRSDPDATQMFRAAPQQPRGWAPEPELDLDDSRSTVPPPPLRSRTQVQSAVRERAGWAAIGAPAGPDSTPPPRPKGPRLRVDWPNCKAHGLCHELLPEAVRLDEWGFPIVGNQPLPSHIIDDARRAVIACPTLALRLVD
jgi:ferredoxin